MKHIVVVVGTGCVLWSELKDLLVWNLGV
jgi:hypothetical protein